MVIDEPWTTVGIGYINFLHSSEELTKLSITDSIQTSLNTEYRCKVLGHTESNWVSSYAFVTGTSIILFLLRFLHIMIDYLIN